MRTDFTQELRELRGPSYTLQGWEEIVLWWALPWYMREPNDVPV